MVWALNRIWAAPQTLIPSPYLSRISLQLHLRWVFKPRVSRCRSRAHKEVSYTHIDTLSDKDEDGFTTCDGDCNDLLPNTFPGSTLDSQSFECMLDADGDGYAEQDPLDPYLPGTDCDDTNSTIYPNAPEICSNGIDENCDGADATNCSTIEPNIVISDTTYPMCSWIDVSASASETITTAAWVKPNLRLQICNLKQLTPWTADFIWTVLVNTKLAYLWTMVLFVRSADRSFTVEEQSIQVVPVQVQTIVIELDGGNVECFESGYSYICNACTATVNTELLATISHPEQEPFVTTWSSQNSAVTILSDEMYPDVSITHSAEQPGVCSAETFELDLRIDYCQGSQTQTIPVEVVCCGTSQ